MTLVAGRDYFRCDYCISFHFPEGTGEDGVRVLENPTGLECPVCRSALQDGRVEGEAVQFCSSCRGFLATNPAFCGVVHKRRSKRPRGESPNSFEPTELKRKLDCPNCRKRMDTHPYYGGGRVVVDTCPRCTLIWLDAGELTVIERHNPLPLIGERIQPAAPSQPPRDDSGDLLSSLIGWHIDAW
jgi:Zn-finger nucleic acid-binding protein